jgi:4-amino-4-deoxy-L-arabinose transferase-like glycosyltransferase
MTAPLAEATNAAHAGRQRLSRPVFLMSLAGAAVFLYLRTFLLPGTPFIAHDDQMLFFERAARMLHGQVLYRDFFEMVTPGVDLLYAAGFRLFGIHAWVMQAWCIALGLALFCTVTWIAGRLFRGPLVLLPGLLFLVFDFDTALDPTHHWYSTLAALAAAGVLMGGASLRRLSSAGLLCGVATLFTQTQGVTAFAALVVWLLWLRRSEKQRRSVQVQLAALVLPFVLVTCCGLGCYVYRAGFRTVYFDLVVFAFRYMSSGDFNSPRAYLRQLPPLHAVSDIARLIPSLFIYAVVPYSYFAGLYRLWCRRGDLPAALRQRLVLLHLVGLGLCLAVATGPRLARLCTVAPPATLVCVWLVSQQGRASKITRYGLCGLAAAFALLLPVYRQVQRHSVLELPIGRTAFTDPAEFHEFQWLAGRTHPGEPFFNQGGLGLYLALDNPTTSEFVNDGDFTRPEQVAEVVEALGRRPPRFIVMEPDTANSPGIQDYSVPFTRYVQDHYHRTQVFWLNGHSRPEEIWERN